MHRPGGTTAAFNRTPPPAGRSQASFSSDDDYSRYMDSQGSSPAGAAPPFGETFQRVSSAVLAAEEAAQRAAAAVGADSGHLSVSGGSQRSSPGAASAGSQPASPLVRMRQAVSGLTSRLMPSALPPLLPAGAVNASGQEQQPLCRAAPAAAARRSLQPAAELPPAAAVGGSKGKGLHVRTSSIGGASHASPSPTAALSHSAGTGAALGRHPDGKLLTPFSELEPLVAAAPLPDGAVSWTPPQRRPLAAASPGGGGAAPWPASAAAAFQSMPATPSELLLPLPPPSATHRRALTAGEPHSRAGTHRRRRRLTIDLLNLADLRPDLAQPGVAAALAIAANPSPRAGGQGCGSAARLRLSAAAVPPLGVAAACAGGDAADSCGAGSSGPGIGDAGEDLALPIRTLHFEDAADGLSSSDEDDAGSSGERVCCSPLLRAFAGFPCGPHGPATPGLGGNSGRY